MSTGDTVVTVVGLVCATVIFCFLIHEATK